MRITIIGAGFSGGTLATLLASQDAAAAEVCLVGVDETFGRGVAYGQARAEHVLNVRAKSLGADPDQPGAFADSLALDAQAREGFVSRLAYGDYLAQRLRTAAATASNLTLVRQEAIAVQRLNRGFRVSLDDGSYFTSDRVVLALGALPPQRLAGIGPRLAKHARYIGWPWQDDALDAIEAHARVLIIGTGLTMADVVATLAKRGHRGGLVAISRHGLLPQAHLATASAAIELPPSVQQALKNQDVRQLLSAMRSLSHVLPDWRAAIDALRPHTQAFWRGLSPAQRGRFLRHLRSYWEVARHRLAPELGDLLDGLRATGQLQVRAARLLRAGLRADSAEVLIRQRGEEHIQVEPFDYVIRATGLDTDVERTTDPLASQLRESGLVVADAHGLGIEVDDLLEVRDAHGDAVTGLYCLGPLLRGRCWEITAVPELREAARALAATLAALPNDASGPVRGAHAVRRELVMSRGL